MSISAPEEMKPSSNQDDIVWKCHVCGFIFHGDEPPAECPQCASPKGEFGIWKHDTQLRYDGEPIDLLLINGSSHRSNNSGYMADIAEEVLSERGVNYRRYNLNEYSINHCWCCYSMRDTACSYPCRDQLDDMAAFHELIIQAKAIIVVSPVNWNNMSARLKDFLDRLNCIQNRYLLKKPGLTEGKVVGIMVSGHEDGATKTAMDIYLYFQQMGYILAPFGISYRIHGAQFNTKTDSEFLHNDELVRVKTRGLTNNVIEMMKLDNEARLKGKLIPVCE